ncbi:MAG TPA: 16S rRNA (cytosine(1402)-N(4))-methyltransferase RsmH [Candidatus Rifleibacterium sp.]|nr:16S rRNA (cytosine(1402)-N(4))-methyltransferase RsmH [Candidatus Rifleibacterium sp.]HPT46984.1 16S rRNA (cytosine(1402)-N(4))-methyltransferase RsmH [Candidatus Rifleibacterium sp.]
MNSPTPFHQSVLVDTVVKYALPPGGEIFVDGTFGLGGHTRAVLNAFPTIKKVIGIDRDAEILEHSTTGLEDPRIVRFQAHASDLPEILARTGISAADGILLDLGVSSWQLDNPTRGFSFSRPGPLDMRMNSEDPQTAADLVNHLDRDELTRIFFQYGEEKFSRRIADAIIRERAIAPFTSTDQLAKIVSEAVPGASRHQSHIHPATRVFQALRIAVNHELEEIERFLQIALACLKPDGHLTLIAFHSLEDRLIKNFMQKHQKGCDCPPRFPVCVCGKKPQLQILTSKAIFADDAEIAQNPRARSARLRSARKLPTGDPTL